jgi:hypothetical protein
MRADKEVRREQQHPIGYAQNEFRSRPPKPTSSHPDADPASAKPLVSDSDLDDYEEAESHRKAIVSINGEDVHETPKHRRVA